eukprot:CAMPEP_0113457944 /NCGR_PEP_ID=MMETSP0014_2-20120614/9667_1 /TAXON_ID=2857 /ORGANISM="Nitzschia sp." /LENGTH=324 /DNA_ID=CAMNT_0000349451 /DNA_START=144 /DNA_END=1118 /DNA_ORIENTATION=+ /assembly_acc=CAM_ASM_000159
MNTPAKTTFVDLDVGALWVQCLTSNNEGVEYMKTGRFDEASASLITSLGAAKSILCHHQIQPSQQQQEGERSELWTLPIVATSLHNIGTAVESSRDGVAATAAAAAADHPTDDLRGVYRDMYVFPHVPTPRQLLCGCTEECLDTLCMVIVFNLALSHHLRAVHTVDRHHNIPYHHLQQYHQSQMMEMEMDQDEPDDQEESWTTSISNAMALYELVYNMQQHRNSHPVSGGGSSSSSVRGLREELYLAILCNLGHIHTMLGQNEKAGAFFQHLLAVLMFLQSSTMGGGGAQSDRDVPIIKPSARETFSWCICSTVLENKNTAPAA